MRPGFVFGVIALLGLLAAACSIGTGQEEDYANQSQAVPVALENTTAGNEYERPDEIPLLKGPKSPDGLQAIFATSDLGIGEQRVAVVITSKNGLVRSPIATITSFYFPADGVEGELRETKLGTYRPFPLNTRGLYSTQLNFDKPGRWGLEINVLDENAATLSTEISFNVMDETVAPSAGVPAPRSQNKTINDVESIGELTTGSLQDPDLYQITIADASASGLPTVIVMASPAFCTNAVCGPQVDVLKELKDKYAGQANFIHIDIYDNPMEIQGDLSRAVISPTVIEWNLPSTEWSFVIDREGLIHQRFEAFTTFEEIEQALEEVL